VIAVLEFLKKVKDLILIALGFIVSFLLFNRKKEEVVDVETMENITEETQKEISSVDTCSDDELLDRLRKEDK